MSTNPTHPGPPLPPELGRRARIALVFAGWFDRWRYRNVADHQHTHLTLRLLALYDDGCAAVASWQVGTETALRRELAELGPTPGEPTVPEVEQRSLDELPDLDRSERHTWARDNRAAHRQLRSWQQAVAGYHAAETRRRTLESDLTRLSATAEAAAHRWLRNLEERLAVYTRARTRGFIQPPTGSAHIPPAHAGLAGVSNTGVPATHPAV